MFTRKTIIVSDGKYKYVVFLKTLNYIFNKEKEKKDPTMFPLGHLWSSNVSLSILLVLSFEVWTLYYVDTWSYSGRDTASTILSLYGKPKIRIKQL